MLGWLRFFRMSISNFRRTRSCSSIVSLSIILTALCSPLDVRVAFLTLPKAPLPRMLLWSSYFYMKTVISWYWTTKSLWRATTSSLLVTFFFLSIGANTCKRTRLVLGRYEFYLTSFLPFHCSHRCQSRLLLACIPSSRE